MDLNLFEPVFLLHAVKNKTGLTGRQIRYYEEKGIVNPQRTPSGKLRVFSLYDIDILNKIKFYLSQGMTLEAVRDRIKGEEPDYYNRTPGERDMEDFDKGIHIESLFPVKNVQSLTRLVYKKRRE